MPNRTKPTVAAARRRAELEAELVEMYDEWRGAVGEGDDVLADDLLRVMGALASFLGSRAADGELFDAAASFDAVLQPSFWD